MTMDFLADTEDSSLQPDRTIVLLFLYLRLCQGWSDAIAFLAAWGNGGPDSCFRLLHAVAVVKVGVFCRNVFTQTFTVRKFFPN